MFLPVSWYMVALWICENFSCRKQLRDSFSTVTLRETIMQIVDTFMTLGSPHHWVDYLMPQDTKSCGPVSASTVDDSLLPNATKFDQLMVEARIVLSRFVFIAIVCN